MQNNFTDEHSHFINNSSLLQIFFNYMSSGCVVFEVLNDGASSKDYIIKDLNFNALKMIGKDKAEIIDVSLFEIIPQIDKYGVIPIFQDVWKTTNPVINPEVIYVEEYLNTWFSFKVFRLPSSEIVVIFDDVTDQTSDKVLIKTEDRLRKIELKHTKYIENAPYGILIVDKKGNFIEVNNNAKKLSGYSKDEFLKMNFNDIISKRYKAKAFKLFTSVLAGNAIEANFKYIHKSGQQRWAIVNAIKQDENIIVFANDITEHKKVNDELVYLSYHDQLTGLYNRRFFEEELKRLNVIRNWPLTIIMADVNGLKLINDSFGHKAGDDVIVSVAKMLKKGCRSDDIIARLGGDEYVILMPKTNENDAQGVIDRINELINKSQNDGYIISVAFGYGVKKNKEQSIEETMSLAENYMYRHKTYVKQSIHNKTIDIIMNTLFEKSSRELQHSERVSELSVAIGNYIGLNETHVGQLRLAGLFHDIGKIGLNEAILNKPSEITKEEYAEIKKHPEAGWRILSSSDEFAKIANFILEHHERWDGKGYPKGLKAIEISTEARIIALADAYDAMTSERPYSKLINIDQAISELEKNAGKQFDPDLTECFIKLLKQEKDL